MLQLAVRTEEGGWCRYIWRRWNDTDQLFGLLSREILQYITLKQYT
jgi:hypothetical protein